MNIKVILSICLLSLSSNLFAVEDLYIKQPKQKEFGYVVCDRPEENGCYNRTMPFSNEDSSYMSYNDYAKMKMEKHGYKNIKVDRIEYLQPKIKVIIYITYEK